MATDLRMLERQINQLQRQVEQQKREADRIRQQLVADNRRQLEEYQEQMRTTLDAHDANVQQEYEQVRVINKNKDMRESILGQGNTSAVSNVGTAEQPLTVSKPQKRRRIMTPHSVAAQGTGRNPSEILNLCLFLLILMLS